MSVFVDQRSQHKTINWIVGNMRPGRGLANAKKYNYDLKTTFFTSLRYNLYATGGHSGTICMQLAARRIKFLPLAARPYSAKPPFFKSTLPEQFFE